MVNFEDALNLVLKNTDALNSREVDLLDSLNCVCAMEIKSPIDMPLFTNSAMDGYAVCHEFIKSVPAEISVMTIIKAGDELTDEIKEHTVKIMTGAPVPPVFDTIVPVEFTEKTDKNTVIINKLGHKGQHVRIQGSYLKKGDTLIEKGSVLNSAHIGLLASIGQTTIEVFASPKIAIIPTGNEIVEINEQLEGSKIRNSNSYIIAANVIESGSIPLMRPIARDDEEAIIAAVMNASDADVIITTGGVSMGDYDMVLNSIQKIGFTKIFHKVAMKPGKPMLFGKLGNKLFFGLPGNPSSALMGFEQFVLPAIKKMKGFQNHTRKLINAILQSDAKGDKERLCFLRAHTYMKDNQFYTSPLKMQESGDLISFSKANSIIMLHENKKEGDVVPVQIISGIF